jgi:hypothetical protein
MKKLLIILSASAILLLPACSLREKTDNFIDDVKTSYDNAENKVHEIIDGVEETKDKIDETVKDVKEAGEKIKAASDAIGGLVGGDEEWEKYTNSKYEFEFNYPSTWTLSTNFIAGSTVIASVTNPERAGMPETDVPIERFTVKNQNTDCEEQANNDWHEGFGLIYYRDSCFNTNDGSIILNLSAYDNGSQEILDEMISSFSFTD